MRSRCSGSSAASHKLRDPQRFRDALAGFELVPAAAVRAFAALVTALELGLGLWLLLPGAGAAPALATGALLALYALAISANLLRGRRALDCGCGARPQPLGEGLVVRNIVLVAIALAGGAARERARARLARCGDHRGRRGGAGRALRGGRCARSRTAPARARDRALA